MLDKFIGLLETEARNHSIYVWGAQGQKGSAVTEAWIRSMENSAVNAERAIGYWRRQVDAGYGEVLRAFDCSGLGVWALMQLGLITSDLNANGLKGKCTPLTKREVRRGDWVFRVNGSGRATHIGYVVDDRLNVIEAYGRDKGVTKNHIDHWGTGYWNWFGRPPYFKEETKTPDTPRVAVLGNSVNIRKGPGIDYPVVRVAHRGEVYPLAGQGWRCIEVDGGVGFISGREDLTRLCEGGEDR